MDLSRYYIGISLEELTKTTKTSVSIVDVPSEIRNKYIPNTILDRYRYAKLFGSISLQNHVHHKTHPSKLIYPSFLIKLCFRNIIIFGYEIFTASILHICNLCF